MDTQKIEDLKARIKEAQLQTAEAVGANADAADELRWTQIKNTDKD